MAAPAVEEHVTAEQRSLILRLFEINALQFGTFTLKSGITSPVYIDLRLTASHPDILSDIATALLNISSHLTYDLLCGVPYTAIPFATAMSLASKTPMLMRRKDAKKHGTKRLIEGVYKPSQKCLIVEDLVTSGLSIMETASPLKDVQLQVTDVVVLLNRQQGAESNLTAEKINLHSVFTLTEMLSVLVAESKIDDSVRDSVLHFIENNQVVRTQPPSSPPTDTTATPPTYAQRAEHMRNPVGRKLLELMQTKCTNLAVAADVTTAAELLELAEAVGPHICMLKTHADILTDWSEGTGEALKQAAQRHNFLLFEDRKFADIGNTAFHQVSAGVHRIATWADIVNAHAVPGPGVISGLQKANEEAEENGWKSMGILLLAEMSSKGNLATALPDYKTKTIEMAKEHPESVFGFISMGKIAGDDFVYMTPGVNLEVAGDGMGQQYTSPEAVITEKGSDVIIVGRGIYRAEDKVAAAKKYRQAGWSAYQKRCNGVN